MTDIRLLESGQALGVPPLWVVVVCVAIIVLAARLRHDA